MESKKTISSAGNAIPDVRRSIFELKIIKKIISIIEIIIDAYILSVMLRN